MNNKYYFKLISNAINTAVQREICKNFENTILYSELIIFTYDKNIIEVLKEIIIQIQKISIK